MYVLLELLVSAQYGLEPATFSPADSKTTPHGLSTGVEKFKAPFKSNTIGAEKPTGTVIVTRILTGSFTEYVRFGDVIANVGNEPFLKYFSNKRVLFLKSSCKDSRSELE